MTEEEKRIENNREEGMEKIRLKAKEQEPVKLRKELIREVVKRLKGRKAADCEGWSNELIIEGREEIIQSLTVLFIEIL